MRIVLPLVGVLLVVFAGLVLYFFKIGLDDYVASRSLASVPVAAPQGWDVATYDAAFAKAITGIVPQDDPDPKTATHDMLRGFASAAAGDEDGVVYAFVRGDERMALRMRRAPLQKPERTLAQIVGQEEAVVQATDPETIFAMQDGVVFVVAAQQSVVAGTNAPLPSIFRHLTAPIGVPADGEWLDVAILTNGSDAALAHLIAGLDIMALNEKLPNPDPNLTPGTGFATQRDTPFSDAPPPKSIAFLAQQMLDRDGVFDDLNHDILEKIRDGEIANLAELQAISPRLNMVSFEIVALLDQGSSADTARFAAATMINSGRDWNNYDYYVLSEVAKAGTSQASLADYLSQGHAIAPEVLALVARLPENLDPGTVPTAAVPSNPTGGAGFGFENCTMQNGVRRCVASGN